MEEGGRRRTRTRNLAMEIRTRARATVATRSPALEARLSLLPYLNPLTLLTTESLAWLHRHE